MTFRDGASGSVFADILRFTTTFSPRFAIRCSMSASSTLKAAAGDLEAGIEKEGHFGDLWGRSPEMRKIYRDNAIRFYRLGL